MKSLLGRIWRTAKDFDPKKSILQNVLALRGFSAEMLQPAQISDLHSPFAFREMEKTVQRIFVAIKKQKRILVYGDYDVDGISGACLLVRTLSLLGAEVSYRLPSRQEGYGLHAHYIAEAKEKNVDLIITVDCGISNLAEVSTAQKNDIDVIITDHHAFPAKTPPAFSILHPLASHESFPDADITGAGVAFFLCWALLQKKFSDNEITTALPRLLELSALGTVGDCGKLIGQNRIITALGVQALQETPHAGLQQLLLQCNQSLTDVSAETIAYYLAPRLNAAGRLAHPHEALELLLGNNSKAETLESLNIERQNRVATATEEAEEMMKHAPEKYRSSLVLASPKWPAGIIGLIAGKLCEKYGVPTVIGSIQQEKITCSCRGPADFHFTKNLQKIADDNEHLFLSFGGHGVAAGFSLLPKDFEKFEKVFSEIVRAERGAVAPVPTYEADGVLTKLPSISEITELFTLEPFGIGNTAPQFIFQNLVMKKLRAVGKENSHLSCFFQDHTGNGVSGIFFHQGVFAQEMQIGEVYDVLATPKIQIWNGQKRLQLYVTDMRSASL